MKKRALLIISLLALVILAITGCGAKKEAQYIGNRFVEYDDTSGIYTVSFAFYATEKSAEAMKQEADIVITITNEDGTVVYDKTTHVTEENYVEQSSLFGSLTVGTVSISKDEIEKGTTEYGNLAISAVLPSGASFDPESQSVYGLPLMDIDIVTPAFPVTINNYDYNNEVEKTLSIDNIEFSYDFSCTAVITATMTYNVNGDSSDDYSEIPYKIKDESGVVVDSGSFFMSPMSVGDTTRQETYIGGVELGKSYTIELSDYSW